MIDLLSRAVGAIILSRVPARMIPHWRMRSTEVCRAEMFASLSVNEVEAV